MNPQGLKSLWGESELGLTSACVSGAALILVHENLCVCVMHDLESAHSLLFSHAKYFAEHRSLLQSLSTYVRLNYLN